MKNKNKKKNKIKNSKITKRKKYNKEVDLWKEIRTNLKPLSDAYIKFKEKREIAKAKEDERKLKEEEKQRVKDEEIAKLQAEEEKKLRREKKIKEEEEKKLKAQEKQRLEEKRLKEEKEDKIRKDEMYKQRLIIGEQARLQQLETVKKIREEENKIIEERAKKISNQKNREEINKDEDQRLRDEDQRLRREEQRLKREELRLKEEEQSLIKKERLLKSDDPSNIKISKDRFKGTVKWYNEIEGHGIIESDENKKNILINSLELNNSNIKSLKEGEKVRFEIKETEKGPSAKNLESISEDINTRLRIVK